MAKSKNLSLYRAMRHLRSGGLHRALKLSEKENIPADRLEKAGKSKNSHVASMASLKGSMKND